MIITTEKKISLPTSCAESSVILIIPSSFSSWVAFIYLRIKCSAITQAPSTITPKSMAPRDSRLAGIPVNFIMRNANNIAKGIVAATTKAARKLPNTSTNKIITMDTPINTVSATVSKECSIKKLRSYKTRSLTPFGSS